MQDEPQLFGAPPGDARATSLSITKSTTGHSLVTLYVHPENRRDLLTLDVTVAPGQGLSTVIGAMMPLLHRTDNLSVKFARRSMWAMHNRLGAMGYEVRIEHCGKCPPH